MKKKRENLADVDRYIEKINSDAFKRYMASIHN